MIANYKNKMRFWSIDILTGNRLRNEAQKIRVSSSSPRFTAPCTNLSHPDEEATFTLLKASFKAVLSELNHCRCGVLLLATNGEVICTNHFADQALASGDGLKTDNKNRLSCRALVDNLRLQKAIARVVRSVERISLRAFEVERGKGSSYLVTILPVYRSGIPVGVITIVIDSIERNDVDSVCFRKICERVITL